MYTEFIKVRNWHFTPVGDNPISPTNRCPTLWSPAHGWSTDVDWHPSSTWRLRQQPNSPELTLRAAAHCQPQLICGELTPFGQRQLLWMLIPPYQFLRVEQACKWVTLMFSCLDKLIPSWFSAGRKKRIFLFSPYHIQCLAELRFIE